MKTPLLITIFLLGILITQAQTTYTVTTTDDTADADLSDSSCEDVNGNCSLRAAIENANKTSNKDSIEFNLSGTTPFVFEITTGVLPPIQEPAILNGRTQPGYIDTPLIEIDGTLLGPGNNGIQFTGGADGSEMYGLAIGGFQEQDVTPFELGFGVFVNSVDNLTIESNYIGLRSDGNTLFTNTGFGMLFNNSSNNTVGGTGPNEGNLISGNFSGGLTFEGGGNNLVQGNLIGTDVTGTLNRGNKFNVQLIDSSNNIIGGSSPEERNVVAGGQNQPNEPVDGTGFSIVGSSATGNKVYGNYIGTDISGTQSIPNLRGGVLLLFGANNNEIGGLNPGEGNVISGNGQYGVFFQSSDTSPVSNNIIQGNKIGTDQSGDIALPNQIGIASLVGDNTFDNSIGGDVPEAKNTISGNSVTGIAILSGTNNTIQGNYIGTNSDGDAAVPNLDGILIDDSNNVVGGTTSGAGNLISGNSDTNLSLEDDAGGTIVQGNFIGTDAMGLNALSSNPGNGIEFTTSISTTTPIIIGGSETGRNIISGNNIGISILGENHDISYNYIGLNASGDTSLPNLRGVRATGDLSGTEIHHNTISGNGANASSRNLELFNASNLKVSSNILGLQADGLNTVSDNNASGITIQNSSNNTIGGSTEDEGNIISGNGLSGVNIVFTSNNNVFENNLIGIASDGATERSNTLNGISIGGSINSALIFKNTIANNNASGIAFSENFGTPTGVKISQNSIFNNSSKGISLSNNSSNDPDDEDSGPNNLQNYPEISALNDLGNGDIEITYAIPSVAPNSTYPLIVEFFSSVSGQGKTYLATDTYVSAGSKTFTATIPTGTNLIDFEFIVGTATDSDGNTSEFSLESTLDVTDFNMNSISIYPNPTTDLLNIAFDQEAEYSMAIYDIQGKLIIKQKSNANQNQIDVSALDKGIYILKVKTQTGQQNVVKFIKK